MSNQRASSPWLATTTIGFLLCLSVWGPEAFALSDSALDEELGFGGRVAETEIQVESAPVLPSDDSYRTKTKSPFEGLFSPNDETDQPPLVRARKALTSLKLEQENLRVTRADEKASRVLLRNFRMEELILAHLEEIAFRRMQRCIVKNRLAPIPKIRTHRMTPAGPIPLTPDELAAEGPLIEPYPCERVRVVDDDLVQTLRRYYVVSRHLQEDDFGWHRRDERAELQKERQELLHRLQPDDPLLSHRPAPDWQASR